MAIEQTPVFKFDEEKIAAKLKTIEENVNLQQGKKLHNPFIWLHKVVNPLIKRLNGYKSTLISDEIEQGKEPKEFPPERSEELHKAIMALPDVPPLPKMSVDNNPTETNVNKDKPVSLGLNLPSKQY
jgi:hypothetical protein